jgi:deoxyribonuclease V
MVPAGSLHSWNVTPKEAVALQRELAARRRPSGRRLHVRPGLLIAGADVSYNRFDPFLHAAVVVLRADTLEVVEVRTVTRRARFPYVPGLLSFREIPAVLAAFAKLKHRPDLMMLDGQGLAHPRRFGLACHLGWWLDLPTFGCAKSLFVGEPGELDEQAGATAPVVHEDEQVGLAVRTRTGVKPVYVSIGHRIRIEDALAWTLATCRGYRIPEPTRLAHLAVNAVRRGEKWTG